jgi:FkbM family methyltransferase
MHEFVYPKGKSVLTTDETVVKTSTSFHPTKGLWEPESIDYFYSLVETKHSNSDAVIVDVGAQSGLYTLYAKHIPGCRFYAFEPFPDTYAMLLDNLQLNSIWNVKALNYAVGSKEETKMLHVPDHLGLNTLGDTPKRFDTWNDIPVQVVRLDDVLQNETSFDYLKCDTEGWEYHVLQGAEESIRKWKPELFVEMNETNLEQCSLTKETLFEYLHSLEYRPVSVVNYENMHFTYAGP